AARRVPGARDAVTGVVDVEKTLRSRDVFSSHWDDKGQAQWVESVGATLFRGYGRLSGPKQVEVSDKDSSRHTLTARRAVVIATGTVAAIPPIEGMAEVQPWTSREITTANHVPERLVVLGGGVVGAEMAQAWKWLGAKEVTIIEMQPRLLPLEEPFAGELVEKAFLEMGILVRTGIAAAAATRRNGEVTVTLQDGSLVAGDEVVVATGRKSATVGIGLESVGLDPGKYIAVNDHLQVTGVDGGWLYAVGDVNGRALFTHQGKYQARIAGDHIIGKEVAAWADDVAVPRVIFTEPQVAAVGPTEEQAREKGLQVQTVEVPYGSTAAASLLGQGVEGRAKLVIDGESRTIIGATFAGPNAGELIHAATVAI
ncbi:MAG: NAD(P)/FAD-dependent oxidoreductase, partial [Dehalococcoidia bacterium]